VAIDLFHYPEEGIFVMTDEEKNVGTEHWPSKENIVSFFFSRGVLAVAHSFTHTGKIFKFSCGPWTISLEMLLPEMPSSSIVSFCANLSSSVDLISIDAGHAGRQNDVGGDYACACNSDLAAVLCSDKVTDYILDILTCDDEKIFDYVSCTRSTTVRHH
jgi:hypothetical protein